MKDKILLGVLLAIVAVGTVVGILDFFVWAQPNPEIQSLLFGLAAGVIFTSFTPCIGLVWKYLFNGLFLHFPILSTFVILRAIASILVWVLVCWGLMAMTVAGGLFDDVKMTIIAILIIIAHVAYRVYRIKNPDVVVNGEEV